MTDTDRTRHGDHDRGAEALLSRVDRDRLLGRLIDGEATPGDWRRFREMAGAHSGAWDELEALGEDREALCAAVERAGDDAERVHAAGHGSPAPAARFNWLGWAAAAAVAILAVTVRLPDGGSGTAATQGASVLPTGAFDTPEEALDHYLTVGREQGRVVEAWPEPVVLETRQLPDQPGVEVVYLRQILERRVIRDAYRVETDEWGRPVVVPEPPTPEMFAPRSSEMARTVY